MSKGRFTNIQNAELAAILMASELLFQNLLSFYNLANFQRELTIDSHNIIEQNVTFEDTTC